MSIQRLIRPGPHDRAQEASVNLVLGQTKTEEKSNEITAIPELLKAMELENGLVTIDAMGCQKNIAETIIDQGGDYLLAVKNNQPKLKAAIKATLSHRKPEVYVNPLIDFFETNETSRDRKEIRRCWTSTSLGKLEMADDWKNLHQIAMIESGRTMKGKTSIERRYYICSAVSNAQDILAASRNHWGIENKLHWVLDMSFREDECRVRKGHGAENLAKLRHIALNLLKQDTTKKLGIKNKHQSTLTNSNTFAETLKPLRRQEWVVYAKRPFAGPEVVLAYLSRYTHRVAIANTCKTSAASKPHRSPVRLPS